MLDVFLFTRKYDRQRETTTEHEGAVGEIRRSHRAVPRILDMAEELVCLINGKLGNSEEYDKALL